jgi:phospholipase/lecithinase/hemolysin
MNVTALRMTQPQNLQTPSAQARRPVRQRLRRWALAAALTLFPAVWGQAGASMECLRHGRHSQPFSRIFVFGDSLSDDGNLFRLSGGYPPPPYFEGRFSNGRVWVEQLADGLGMEIADGDNYAVGGATTGFFNSNNGVNGRDYPGLQGQLASFEATRSAEEAQGALFTVWAGANDFFVALKTGQTPAELIGNGVGNTVQAIQQLWQAGARHIMVANIPDLGLTPFALRANIGAPVTQLSAAYNQVLDAALDSLAAAGIPTIRVDAFATLRQMVAQPAEFGFTNVTDRLMYVGGNPAEFLFWDDVHPTTAGHAVFAEAAADSLISYFSPRQGKGTPPARINALNGLVNAWDNN